MIIRVGTPTDAKASAILHCENIEDGFLTSLGPAFLSRLYRRIARHARSHLVVAEEDNEVVGFAAGSENVPELYRAFLLRDGLSAAVVAAPRLLSSWRRALETLRYPSAEAVELPRAELLSVAVNPSSRGKGVARALVGAVAAELRQRGSDGVRVVVDAENQEALALYAACGFHFAAGLELHPGTISQVLTWP